MSPKLTRFEEAQMIDHAILAPEISRDEMVAKVKEAVALQVGTVCVNPAYAALVAPLLEGTDTDLCLVVDFPFGQSTTAARVASIEAILSESQPTDLDIVGNYALLRSGEDEAFVADLKACRQAAKGVTLKVILEVDALTEDEVRRGVRACIEAGADFAKTSTGFYPSGERHGATLDVIETMLDEADGKIAIKASGGIRTREHFLKLLDLGVKKIGASGTAKLLGDE